MRKTIYVAGATGYVGRNITKTFTEKGYKVIALTRRDPSIENVEWRLFDPLNPSTYENLNLENQTVINCIAVTSNEKKVDCSANYLSANILAMKAKNGKLIHISSSSIYNLLPTKYEHSKEYKEEMFEYVRHRFLNEYSRTKALCEEILMTTKYDSGVKIISLRPHAVYGKDDTTLMPKIIDRIKWSKDKETGSIFLPDKGNSYQTLTHIDNLVQAVELSLDFSPTETFTAFNIADARAVQLSHAITAYVQKEFPKMKKLKFKGLSTDFLLETTYKLNLMNKTYEIVQVGYSHLTNIQKAKEKLGYNPTKFVTP